MRWMPCHSPINTRSMCSTTSVLPSWLMLILSLKLAMRQLFAYACRLEASSTHATHAAGKSPRISIERTLGMDLELHGHGFTISLPCFKELFLLKPEHASNDIGRERLDLGIQIAHDCVVVTARI